MQLKMKTRQQPYYHILIIAIIFLISITTACDDQEVADDGRDIKTHEDAWDFYTGFKDKINGVGNIYDNDESVLPSRVIELGALITARYWSAEIDWSEHVEPAILSGISNEIIESIKIWERPDFEGDFELETAYQYSVEILTYKKVTDVTYEKAVEAFGKKGVVELAGLLGHHTMIGLTLKAFRLKPDISPNLLPGEWEIELDHSEVDNPRKTCYGLPFSPKGWPMSDKLNQAETLLGTAWPFMAENLHELSIIITARAWNCCVPWTAHVPSALAKGVQPKAVKAIGVREDPSPYLTTEEQLVYRMAMELFDNSIEVSEETYNEIVELIGRPQLVKMVTAMGYYSQVSLAVSNAQYILFPLLYYPFPVE